MSPPATKFTLFGSLPTELRLEIWKLSCQQRVVEVRYNSWIGRYQTTARLPRMLQVCRESRHEALLLYKKAFTTPGRPEYIYFCPSLDILYLPRHGQMGYDDAARDFSANVDGTSELVLNLAIDHVNTDIIRPWEPYNKLCLIQSFPNLQNTYLVLGAGQEDAGGPRSPSEILLADPADDAATAMQLVENVVESFIHEIQQIAASLSGGRGQEEVWFMPDPPSLIPKAKLRRRLGEYGAFIRCA